MNPFLLCLLEKLSSMRISHGSRVGVFGSSLTCEAPSDIDLLFLYDPKILSLSRVSENKANISRELVRGFSRPVHITVLSTAENTSSKFAVTVNALFIDQHVADNKAINSDTKKLRCAPLSGAGYGKRYVVERK